MQGELWKNGKLNRHLIARDMPVLAESFRLPPAAAASKFLLVEETGIGKAFPLSGEKLALVLTVYRASGFQGGDRDGAQDPGFPGPRPFHGPSHHRHERGRVSLPKTFRWCGCW